MTDSRRGSRSVSPDAEDVFAEYLFAVEAGNAPSFSVLLEEHRSLEHELRLLEEDWRALEELHSQAFGGAGSLLEDLALVDAGEEAPESATARSVFAEFILRQRTEDAESIEGLCEKHPEFAGELVALNDRWRRIERLFAEADVGASIETTMLVRRVASSLADPGQMGLLLRRLVGNRVHGGRYGVLREVARGGMGAILQVWDATLRRNLAMKVIARKDAGTIDFAAPESSITRPVARFLEEAQVTGQLDHPGIVPVHELGVDEEGRAFFTMRLVRGRDLGEILADVHAQRGGWTQTRVLHVLLKVCEALSYAHSKGVIHRDLKPGNVMVGRFGETYVMDWGLARVRGRHDPHDLRLQDLAAGEPVSVSVVETDRKEDTSHPAGGGLVTMDGDVVGTPAYMPPEQARGELGALGPSTDVYAAGALLYHLLSGTPPFIAPGERVSGRAVLARVLEGRPESVARLAPDAPVELVAICEKAMSLEPTDRYPDMSALGEDLLAFLERRVVRAYRTGPVAEFTKWVSRNRLVSGLAGTLLLAFLGGLAVTSLHFFREKEDARQGEEQAVARLGTVETKKRETEAQLEEVSQTAKRATVVAQEAEAGREQALEQAEVAQGETARVVADNDELKALNQTILEQHERILRLSNARRLEETLAGFEQLPATVPSSIPALEAWSSGARALVEELQVHERELQELREEFALPRSDEQIAADREAHSASGELAAIQFRLEHVDADHYDVSDRARELQAVPRLRAREEALLGVLAGVRRWEFAEDRVAWRHNLLVEIVDGVHALNQPGSGAIAEVESRVRRATSVQGVVSSDEVRDAWTRAQVEIADPSRFPLYGGLSLAVQEGLVPLGELRIGELALYEFWHVPTGERPPLGNLGHGVTEGSGLVMILVPGGSFTIGSERPSNNSTSNTNHLDRDATHSMGPIHRVELDAFFLSKFEASQDQWTRWTDTAPSYYVPQDGGEPRWNVTTLHPVEFVDWEEGHRQLAQLDLCLPTEAQWEVACRAGTGSPWWTGVNPGALSGRENLADAGSRRRAVDGQRFRWDFEDSIRDDFGFHATVDEGAPNPYGFHFMAGNVAEWCADSFIESYGEPPQRSGDGLRDIDGLPHRTIRGGSFKDDRRALRSTSRRGAAQDARWSTVGLRPARGIDP